MSLKLARVVATHPEDHSVDLVMVEDGARLAGVQVLSFSASSNTGFNDLPDPGAPASGDKWSLSEKTDRDMLAVVGYIGRVPVVQGFLFPQVCELLFADRQRRMDRHASDLYTTIDKDGNLEVYHPSGTFMRIATTMPHDDLTGDDFDKKFKITKNTDKAVGFNVEVWAGGAKKSSFTMFPNGSITVDGTVLTLIGATSINLQTSAVTISSGATVTHGGVNIGKTHVHSGVTAGASNTGQPV